MNNSLTDEDYFGGLIHELGLTPPQAIGIAQGIRHYYERSFDSILNKETFLSIFEGRLVPNSEQKKAINNIINSLFQLVLDSLTKLQISSKAGDDNWNTMVIGFICVSLSDNLPDYESLNQQNNKGVSLSWSHNSQKISVHDTALRQRAAQDLKARLPTGIDFVVDVEVLTDFNVRVQVDRHVYIVTFSIHIGLDEASYKKAISYAVDLIYDNLHSCPLLFTSTRLEATTSFPIHDDLIHPQLVAVGATADVYQAFQPSVQRTVAVKVFRDRSETTVAAAISEASKLAAIDHYAVPSLISVCGFDSSIAETPYLIVEWRNGRSLSDRGCLQQFLNLPYGERLRHFVHICSAIYSLHLAGIVHGDIHSGNIIYDSNTQDISVIDIGKSLTCPIDDKEFGIIDVKGLARLFTSIICIPPIPFITEMVDNVSSVKDMLTLLSAFPLLRFPKYRPISQALLSLHAEQRYIRMSEWIHTFRQQFDIQGRITFHYDSTSQIPLQTEWDSSSQRVSIVCGPNYDLVNELSAFCREMIRILRRDWAFVQGSRLLGISRHNHSELERSDRSKELEAGRGLSVEQLLEELPLILTGELPKDSKPAPAQKPFVELSTYSQILLSAAAVDWLRIEAPKGRFGKLTIAQTNALDKLIDEFGSFTDGSAIRQLTTGAEFLNRELSSNEVKFLNKLEKRCLDVADWPMISFAILAEGLSLLLSSFEGIVLFTPVAPRYRHFIAHPVGKYRLNSTNPPLTLTYYREDVGERAIKIINSDQEMIDFVAIVTFERSARGTVSESFYCGKFSLHGRVGVGNIFGVDAYYGILEDGKWDEILQIMMHQVLQIQRGGERLKVRLRELFEDFVSDLRRARYDGRIDVIDDWDSIEWTSMMRKLGLITLINHANASVDALIEKHIADRIDVVLNRISDIGN